MAAPAVQTSSNAMDGGVIFLTADQLKGAWDALLTEPKFFEALYLNPETLGVKKSADKKPDAPKTVSEREGKKPNGGTPPSFAGVPEFERLSATLLQNDFFNQTEFGHSTQLAGPGFDTDKKKFYVHPSTTVDIGEGRKKVPVTEKIAPRARDLYNWLNEEENAATKKQFEFYYKGLWNEMFKTMTTGAAPPNDIAGDGRGNNAAPTPRPRVAQSDDVREELKQIFKDKQVLVNEYTWEQIKMFTPTDFRNKLGSDGLRTLIKLFPNGHGINKNLDREVLKKAVHAYIHSNGSAPAPAADDAADDDNKPVSSLVGKNDRDGDEEKRAKIEKLENLLGVQQGKPVLLAKKTSNNVNYKGKPGFTENDKLTVEILMGLAKGSFYEGLGSETVKAIGTIINDKVGKNTIPEGDARKVIGPAIHSFFQTGGAAPQMPAESSTTGSTVRRSSRLNQDDQGADSKRGP